MGPDQQARGPVATKATHPSPVAKPAFRRQTSKVGAGCGNAARPYARCRRSAGVEDHITSERNVSEPERSHVRPQAAEPTGPHREGEEPKPMMHGHEKSDSAIVATKLPNKAGRPAAEAVERRAEAKENANRCRTCRTQGRESVSPTPERVRKAEASRQTSEVGAVCRKAARPVLCGLRLEKRIELSRLRWRPRQSLARSRVPSLA